MAKTDRKTPVEGASIPLGSSPSDDGVSPKRNTNHAVLITWSSFVVTIPILALTVAFLVLVFKYRVSHGDAPFESLRTSAVKDDGNALYVNMNSSILLFLASWASSVATMLSGFMLTLASFPIARRFFQDIQSSRVTRLPTPYQLALTLKFLDGSTLGAIWSWIVYLVSWRKTRAPLTPPLTAASSIALLATLLGLLVALGDTWLHLTTTTVEFTQVVPVTNQTNYGFGLIPECLTSNNSVAAQSGEQILCSVSLAVTGSFLRNGTTSLGVLNDMSDQATVSTYTDPQANKYTFLQVPEGASLSNRDYTAKTYGARTQCELISTKCKLQNNASIVTYNCSSDFAGSFTQTGLKTAFFTNDSMAEDMSQSMYNKGVGNPYYFAAADIMSLAGGEAPNSTEFVKSLHGPYAFILGCNTTIYDIEYDRVNNTITRFVPTISNTSASNVWQTSISHLNNWYPTIEQTAGAAILSGSAQVFVDKIAEAFSKVTIALGADAVDARPALAAQDRESFLVARLPKAPLITLVAVCFLYVLCGLIFTVLAMVAVRHKIPDIQARMSIAGLVADRFGASSSWNKNTTVDEMFEEYSGKSEKRVAIESPDLHGAPRFTTWTVESTVVH
ncbi:hypothetical protein P875_00108587 [Aspergillus parasiticus SU-1]|uniref:Uncharacterized protein n=2 Tax=Aspergillus parasiticus TaxID=5067 RepID=A0A0F0IN28_ASPPU|nr:hypothetical protein P875_00108587 [Aspergillus parasiticus SU-1]